MIARPLDLAAKLRPEPRNFDGIFFVNVGLIGLFFSLFGSQFVLSPGIGVDFQMPRFAGAAEGAAVTTHRVTLTGAGTIITDVGPKDMIGLREWLKREARNPKFLHPRLNLIVDASVPTGRVNEVMEAAREAGFLVLIAADVPTAGSSADKR